MVDLLLLNFMAVKISPVNIEGRQKIGIQPGDTVRVWQKIQERGKTRLQAFEGLVLARKHGNEPGATFTVRRVSQGVGIEKIFPLYSPMIDKIEVLRRSKVRRAKLYFIREKVAREIRRQMRNMRMMDLSTESDLAEKEAATEAGEEVGEVVTAAEVSKEEASEEKVEENVPTTLSDKSEPEEGKDEPKAEAETPEAETKDTGETPKEKVGG